MGRTRPLTRHRSPTPKNRHESRTSAPLHLCTFAPLHLSPRLHYSAHSVRFDAHRHAHAPRLYQIGSSWFSRSSYALGLRYFPHFHAPLVPSMYCSSRIRRLGHEAIPPSTSLLTAEGCIVSGKRHPRKVLLRSPHPYSRCQFPISRQRGP